MTGAGRRATTGAVRVRACAKINLSLRVLGRRPDGYHDLRTIFQSLALHDTLTFTAIDGRFEITTDDPACPRDRSNLVWKAAERLWAAARRRGAVSGVRVHIHKRIPVEAGLGGGSSDAAATLRALRHAWRLRMDDDALLTIASTLGADVPFFFDGGSALGLDRGDITFPLQDEPPASVVIARPGVGVSAKDAYAWWDELHIGAQPGSAGRRAGQGAASRRADTGGARALDARLRRNDLEPPVVARFPGIRKLIRALDRHGAGYAAMSGSGSAVFGLFDLAERARSAAAALRRSGVQIWLTRTTTHRQHARLSAVQVGGR
jgi:4-diphosphocytidyl-2-C-methyl-D-erythritol kinase